MLKTTKPTATKAALPKRPNTASTYTNNAGLKKSYTVGISSSKGKQ